MRAAWIAFSIASAFFLFEFVTRVEPSLATGAIAHFYGLSNADFGTLASLFFWVYAPMQIVVGLLLDRYGARKFILLGSFTCAAGMLVFAATDNVVVGGFGRALTGFGASFAFVAALWLTNHWFRARALRAAVRRASTRSACWAPRSARSRSPISWRRPAGARCSSPPAPPAWRSSWSRCCSCASRIRPPSTATTGPGEHIRQSLADVLGHPRTWVIAIVSLLYYMPVNVYAGLWGTTELMKDHHLTRVTAETAVSMIFWGTAAGSVAGGWLSDAARPPQISGVRRRAADRARLCGRALSAGRRD